MNENTLALPLPTLALSGQQFPDSRGSPHSERNRFLSFTVSRRRAKSFAYINSFSIL